MFVSKGTRRKCARVSFDKSQTIEELEFDKCFFGAEKLEFQEFVQSVVNAFDIPSVDCKSDLDNPTIRAAVRDGIIAADPRSCRSSTGDLKVTIRTPRLFVYDMEVVRAASKPIFH
jgi:hypothetical protein